MAETNESKQTQSEFSKTSHEKPRNPFWEDGIEIVKVTGAVSSLLVACAVGYFQIS